MLNLCGVTLPNSGAPLCDKEMGIPQYLIVGDKSFDDTETASSEVFKTALKAAGLTSRNTSGKLIVLPLAQDVQNRTGENTTGTLNQGFTEVLRQGLPAFDLGVKVSTNHAQKFVALNGQELQVFVVDNNQNVWGAIDADDNFVGFTSKIFAGGDNFTDGQNSKTQLISWSILDIVQFKTAARYMPIDFSVKSYGILKDVYLEEAAANATNVFKITGKIPTGRVHQKLDVYEDFSTAMANAARWICKNLQTGATITITGVAVNAAGYWDVTIDSATYTALTVGDKFSLEWAGPSTLDAANVKGVESVLVICEKS
jgi:hypothetical protein